VQQPIESPSRAGESQVGCDGRKEEPMQPVEQAIITLGQLEVRYLIDGTAPDDLGDITCSVASGNLGGVSMSQ
jgi:hypothetical protein